MLATCFFHRPEGKDEGGRDAGIGAALGHQGEHVALAGGERVEPAGASAGGKEVADHLGVERGAAGRDPGHGVGELVHVGDQRVRIDIQGQVVGVLRD
jgi:hypothetical protein